MCGTTKWNKSLNPIFFEDVTIIVYQKTILDDLLIAHYILTQKIDFIAKLITK
jgi:hypothetical protein